MRAIAISRQGRGERKNSTCDVRLTAPDRARDISKKPTRHIDTAHINKAQRTGNYPSNMLRQYSQNKHKHQSTLTAQQTLDDSTHTHTHTHTHTRTQTQDTRKLLQTKHAQNSSHTKESKCATFPRQEIWVLIDSPEVTAHRPCLCLGLQLFDATHLPRCHCGERLGQPCTSR